MVDNNFGELREKVAQSCRILAMMGLVREITGHVSARVPGTTDEIFIRCRGDSEYGIEFTQKDAIRRVDLDGNGTDIKDNYEIPLEFPIHGEIYKRRPEVGCVIHAHPTSSVLCSITNVKLKPIIGAYDPHAMMQTLGGVPMFPRSILIKNPETAASMIAVMGNKDVCLMKGHGITVTGRTVEEATIRAIKLEHLANMTWEIAQSGRDASEIAFEDIEDFSKKFRSGPALPRGEEWIWRYYVRLLQEKEGTNI